MHNLALQQSALQGETRVLTSNIQSTTHSVDKLVENMNKTTELLERRFAPLARFQVVERVVLGFVGLVLVGVVLQLMTQVLQQPAALPRP